MILFTVITFQFCVIMSPALMESKTIFNVFQKMFKWFKKKINTERKKYSSELLHFVYSVK